MASVNKVILLGHVGRKPELKETTSGGKVCRVSLATTRYWKDQTGQRCEETEWHNCIAYNRIAEILSQYLDKGSMLYAEGRLRTRKWTDDKGVERYTTEIIIEAQQFMSNRNGNQAAPETQPARQTSAAANYQRQPAASAAEIDEDCPF
jgi:single-strand DNA-binding protein|nr:MAG TPA: Single strand binding protein [Caudoviricetes sp.]